jgi:DNA-binding winged helix-turn-helix (wHTH) protein/TolB-like protein/tetratricopeptide (TPR) repeat protein
MDVRVDPIRESAGAPRFRILDLEVDIGRQLVMRAGQELHVPKLSFDLLVALIHAAPNLLSVPDLMEEVWPKQVVGVETVTQRIKLLRKALGDDANQPRYVVGERRRGYRLLPPVDRVTVASDSLTPASEAAPPMANRARRPNLRVMAWGIVLVVAGVAGVTYVLTSHEPLAIPKSAPAIASAPTAGPASVALLPFQTSATSKDDSLAAAGLADLVVSRLRGERDLTVMTLSADPRSAALDLAARSGARYVVDGTVQFEEHALKVTATVMETPSGRHMGAILVERPTDELFHLQDDIADRIITLILGRSRAEGPLAPEYGSDAMLAYLRGRALLDTRKESDAVAAVAEFSRAAQLAPTFAAAHAGVAEAHLQSVFLVNAVDENADQLNQDMAASIDKAIELDPNNGPALFIRAKYRELYGGGGEGGARSDYERAMVIAPDFSPGVAYYADYMAHDEGNLDKAITVLSAGIKSDPTAARLIYMKGLFLQFRHEDDAAAALLLQTLRVAPQYTAAYTRLAELRWAQGRPREALRFEEQAAHIDPTDVWARGNLARIYIELDDLSSAGGLMKGTPSLSGYGVPALACYRQGNLDAAYEWLRPMLQNPHTDGAVPAVGASLTALLEWAQKTHRYAAARQRLLSMRWLKNTQGELDYGYPNAVTLLQLATLEQLAGNEADARDIATRVLSISDELVPGSPAARRFTGITERNRMLAFAILGRDEEALAELAKIRDTLGRQLWWVWIERHPAMARLRRDPRVQRLLEELRSWSVQEREGVDADRAAAHLPVRSGEPYRCVEPPAGALT